MTPDKKGFTLIELIVVIIIIGILAAVAAPIMGNVKSKTICAEAVMMMGSIRTSLRMYYVEHGAYPDMQEWLVNLDPAVASHNFPGLAVNDLTGTYFGKECFYVFSSAFGTYTISCYFYPPYSDGIPSTAPKADEGKRASDAIGGLYPGVLYMDRFGKVWQNYVSRSGYPTS